ncbi:MAG: hypothetical protein M0Z61_11165 [Nitrospiraceae bacterium]|nr:hypothetical protein [Nitrospiraceae bacterium]
MNEMNEKKIKKLIINNFSGAALVVAHPDDEILWFSSVMDSVDEIIVCFLANPSNSEISSGRTNTLKVHPAGRKISSLGLDESQTFCNADWRSPEPDQFGLKINHPAHALKYAENYGRLAGALKEKLAGYKNVITHNPWGEYGHEEHVQVYRAVNEIKKQKDMGFSLWFSNYCSNRSFKLAMKYITGLQSGFFTLRTGKDTAGRIKDLYTGNRCWTWYDDWEWFDNESFIMDNDGNKENLKYGRMPLNMIIMENTASEPKPSRFQRIRGSKKIMSLISKLGAAYA